MYLETNIKNGKVKFELKKDEYVEKTVKIKQSTVDKLEEVRSDLDVTTSEAVGLIIDSFYGLYKDDEYVNNTEETNMNSNDESNKVLHINPKQAKEERKNEVRELLKNGVNTRAEIAKAVGVKKSRVSEYIREIELEDGHLYGYTSEREIQQAEKENRINKTIELRELGKYTRAELAELVGVSKSTMDQYIKEINKMSVGV